MTEAARPDTPDFNPGDLISNWDSRHVWAPDEKIIGVVISKLPMVYAKGARAKFTCVYLWSSDKSTTVGSYFSFLDRSAFHQWLTRLMTPDGTQ